MKRFLRGLAAVWMSLCLLPSALGEVQRPQPTPYPQELQIVIRYEEWTHENGTACEVAVPQTCREDVNAQLYEAQKQLFAETAQHTGENEQAEVRATYRISGRSWAGFLLMGRVTETYMTDEVNYELIETRYLCQKVLAFDMATGKPLTLADVFPENSDAWAQVSSAVRTQLNAMYEKQTHNEQKTEELCSPASLAQLPFLPCAGRLALSLPLWPVVEGKMQLCTVNLMYPDYRPWMTEEARQQTDNSHRPIAALTYDDGPIRVQTPKVIRHLDTYGASATFFCLARSLSYWPDLVRQELDSLHTVGSHTYKHDYEFRVEVSDLRNDRDKCLQLHRELTGVEPILFRPPGGNSDRYVKYHIGWPIVLWNESAGDTGNNTRSQLVERVSRIVDDGDIVLMHDIRKKTADGTAYFLENLTQQGYLFATVDEMLYLHGIEIQPDTLYRSVYSALEEQDAR